MKVLSPLLRNKIQDWDLAQKTVAQWLEDGEKVVFTNGVFDIMHPGHVNYLTEAKSLGDKLVIGLNADSSVKQLNKGDDRPINNEMSRGVMLAALASVDLVVVFDEDTPLQLIQHLKPNILVKGGDYNVGAREGEKGYIVGSEEVKSNGGEVKSITFVEGYSTTSIINKIRKNG